MMRASLATQRDAGESVGAPITLITGGVRSGKSTFAETLAADCMNVDYIATSVPTDGEMRARIRRHRARRPPRWRTVEVETNVAQAIADSGADVVLLECVTTLVSNILVNAPWSAAGDEVRSEIDRLLDAARVSRANRLIIVTNEVGLGVIPATRLGRRFGELLGSANQRLAAAAETVYFLVSGIPLRLKPSPE